MVLLDLGAITLPSGAREFGPFARPANMVGFQVTLGRCTTATPALWSDVNSTIEIQLDASFDGGNTWSTGGAFGPLPGGIRTNRTGEVPAWIIGASWNPLPTHIRGRVIVINGPVPTTLLVETYAAT